MELHEIKTLWTSVDSKIDQKLDVNRILLKEVSINKIKGLLYEFGITNVIGLVFNIPFFIFLTGYTVENFLQLRFALPAVVLAIMSICSIVWNIYHLQSIAGLNYHMPVTKVQKTIESYRLYERRETKLLFVLIPIFSWAFTVVFCDYLLNLDLYDYPAYMWSHLGGSIVVGIIIAVLLLKFPDKKLIEASDFLKEIENFQS